MNQAFRQRWNQLTTVRTHPPAHPSSQHARLWGGIGVLVGLLYLAVLYGPVRAAGAAGLWLAMETWRTGLLIALSAWVFACQPWRTASPLASRRGRFLAIISLIIAILTVAVALVDPAIYVPELPSFSFYAAQLWIALMVRWVVVRGHIQLGALVFIASFVGFLLAATGEALPLLVAVIPYLLALLILCSGLLLRWWAGLVMALGVPPTMALLQAARLAPGQANWTATLATTVMLLTLAGLVALYAWSLERALSDADRRATELAMIQETLLIQHQQLQAQSAALQTAQSTLHETIATQQTQIHQAVAALQEHSVELATLTTPLSEVSAGVLVAPLVGAWNNDRIDLFERYLLAEVERHAVRAVVFDMQVLVASERLGHMLERILRTLALLGCHGVLVGIQPETAQILLNLALDWQNVPIAGTLADGVRLAARLVAPAPRR